MVRGFQSPDSADGLGTSMFVCGITAGHLITGIIIGSLSAGDTQAQPGCHGSGMHFSTGSATVIISPIVTVSDSGSEPERGAVLSTALLSTCYTAGAAGQ